MLLLGLFFLGWVRLAPLQRPAEPNPTGERSDEGDVPREPPAP